LMPHYIQTFFEHLGSEFTFLSYDEMLGEFWDRTLPILLSNCIAAMASRYVTNILDVNWIYNKVPKGFPTFRS
jgi:hypothetical protein